MPWLPMRSSGFLPQGGAVGAAPGPSPTYTPGAVYWFQTELRRATALLGSGGGTIADGPNWTYLIWFKGNWDNSGNRYQGINSNYFGATYDTVDDSEHVKGFDIGYDNAGAKDGNLRVNSGDVTGAQLYTGIANYVAHDNPAPNSKWTALLASGNMRWGGLGGGGRISAAYLIPYGGTPVRIVNDLNLATQFDINWSNPNGFAFGGPIGAHAFPPAIAQSSTEVWLDCTHSIVTSTDGVNASIPTADIQKFVDANGFPVDLGSVDGSAPYGYQPTIYLRGGAATFPTNRGYGGAFAITAGVLADAPVPPTGLAANRVAQNWIVQDFNNLASFTTHANNNNSAVGDMVMVTLNVPLNSNSDTTTLCTAPAGWTTVFNQFINNPGAGGSYQILARFYKVLDAADILAHPLCDFTFGCANGQRFRTTYEMTNYGQNVLVDDCQVLASNPNSTSIVAPNATATTTTDLAVFTGFDWGSNWGPYTAPTGYAERSNSATVLGVSSGVPGMFTSDKQLSASGTVTGPTGTSTVAAPSVGCLMLLKHS